MSTPQRPAGREITGNYTMADALYVPPAVVRDEHLINSQQRMFLIGGQNLVRITKVPVVFDAHLTFVRCQDDTNRPARHEGDWPVQGDWYLTRPVNSQADGVPGIRIIGFEANHPYYNAFSFERFIPLEDGREFATPMPFMSMN